MPSDLSAGHLFRTYCNACRYVAISRFGGSRDSRLRRSTISFYPLRAAREVTCYIYRPFILFRGALFSFTPLSRAFRNWHRLNWAVAPTCRRVDPRYRVSSVFYQDSGFPNHLFETRIARHWCCTHVSLCKSRISLTYRCTVICYGKCCRKRCYGNILSLINFFNFILSVANSLLPSRADTIIISQFHYRIMKLEFFLLAFMIIQIFNYIFNYISHVME